MPNRRMRMRAVLRAAASSVIWSVVLSAIVSVGAVSCFGPTYPEGIPCSEAQTCPPGQICDVYDNVCRVDPLADPCAADPCGAGGACTREGQEYGCACSAGYDFDGATCVEIDECSAAPCGVGGVCVDGVNGYTCTCAAGYDFDGATCVLITHGLVGAGTADEPRRWDDGVAAVSCQEYLAPALPYLYEGSTGDGVYVIQPPGAATAVPVFCDMTTDGGGWTGIDLAAAAALGGKAQAVLTEGAGVTCGVAAGVVLEGFYTGSGTKAVVCQYDIDLGFAFDTIRISRTSPDRLELVSVNIAGGVTDVSNHLAAPWGENIGASTGDVVIGSAAHAGPVLSLGAALGLAPGAVRSFGNGAVIAWPADQTAPAPPPPGTVLRIQLSERGTENEGYRWVAGRVFVR